jgi:hypothetical protein
MQQNIFGKLIGEIPLGKRGPILKFEDNIKVELTEINCEVMNWTELPQQVMCSLSPYNILEVVGALTET